MINVAIVEDEFMIAKRLKRFVETSLNERGPVTIRVFHQLDDASDYLSEHQIDILFLDHNKHCEFAICQRFQSGKIDITFTAVGNQTTMKPQSSALGTGMGNQYIFARMNEAYQDDWHHSIAQNEESWSFTVSFPSTKKDGSGHD